MAPEEIQPGNLIRVTIFTFPERHFGQIEQIEQILTCRSLELGKHHWERKILRVEEFSRPLDFRRGRNLTLIARSLEEVPLEDWSGIAHLLHPKLRIRVQEWIQKSSKSVI